ERRRYNQTVMAFNGYRRTVFGSFFANIRGLKKPAEYFEAEESATQIPKVEF
ncbi:MAG: LemA family protein, partial [Candidatus Omnitrophica bacterium]|nr:LemA family protein [Candidatus Omnitrophota bacterium]